MQPTVHRVLHGPITPIIVFQDAPLVTKLVVVLLIASIVAALVVLGTKLAQGRRLPGGSAYLSGLRLGGPIIGLLGACYTGLRMSIGIGNAPFDITFNMLAPGLAESFMQVFLGFLAGAVAVLAHWVVESRIDRQVLGA